MEKRLGDPAMRTRRLASLVSLALRDAGWDDDLAVFAGSQVVTAAKGKEPLKLEDNGGTSALLYLPRSAVARLSALCEEHREALTTAAAAAPVKGKTKAATSVLPTEAVNEIVTSRNGIINLFGRMLAELRPRPKRTPPRRSPSPTSCTPPYAATAPSRWRRRSKLRYGPLSTAAARRRRGRSSPNTPGRSTS